MTATFGTFTLDVPRRLVRRGGTPVHLTPKAFDLLHVLVTEAPRVVTKGELHARLWAKAFVSDATLTGLVKELRRALDDTSRDVPLIRTAHGVGYALAVPVEGSAAALGRDTTHWLVMRGRRMPLHAGQNVVGRDPSADVWIDAAGVSRRHACIVVTDDVVTIEDLGSKNGTVVGDARIERHVAITDGERLSFGASPCVYRVARDGISTETRATRTRAPRGPSR
jgi:DNA-binding winged helix-turn-helix (wHTH) protein